MKHRLVELIARKEIEINKRLKQSDLALAMGIPENTLSNWLNSKKVRRADHRIVIKMCRYFGCNLGDLLYIDWTDPEDAA